jgi:hypothetical protein
MRAIFHFEVAVGVAEPPQAASASAIRDMAATRGKLAMTMETLLCGC